MSQLLFSLFFFGFGTIIGSFINVLVIRIKNGDWQGLLCGRSACPGCSQPLSWRDLLPLISFCLLKGRCRHCRLHISLRYLGGELLTGLTFAFAFFSFPQAFDNFSNFSFFFFTLLLFGVLIFTALYDLFYFEIVDHIMLPAIVIAFFFLFHPLSPGLESGLVGAALIFAFFYLQILVSRGRWLGGGDLRVGVLMGLTLGTQNGIIALILGYLIGSAVSLVLMACTRLKLRSEIPFAPFLCSGTFLAFYYGESIARWYLNLLGLNNS